MENMIIALEKRGYEVRAINARTIIMDNKIAIIKMVNDRYLIQTNAYCETLSFKDTVNFRFKNLLQI